MAHCDKDKTLGQQVLAIRSETSRLNETRMTGEEAKL
jgi:hypothetical protein